MGKTSRSIGRLLSRLLVPALVLGAFAALAPPPDDARLPGAAPAAHALPGDPNVVGSTPFITGSLRVGGTLSVVRGTWNPTTVNFSVAWYVDGEVKGYGNNYTPVPEDLNKSVKVSVTGSKAGYNPDTKTSATFTIGAGELTAPEYRRDGAAVVGQQIGITALGAWAPLPVNVNYEWRYNGALVPNSDAPTHVVRPDGVGKVVTVKVIGSKLGYDWHERVYEWGRILHASFIQVSAPELSGTVKVGGTLSVGGGSWTPEPTGNTILWYRNDVDQVGTGSSYALTEADAGARIRAVQTVSRDGYFELTWSAEREVPLLDFRAAPPPAVTGTVRDGSAKVGSPLTAKPGAWSPKPLEYSYQWLVDGAPVPGAEGASYTPAPEDEGKRISVRVTAKRAYYQATTRHSAAHLVRWAGYVPPPAPLERLSAAPKPRISGAAKVGRKLSVKIGAWKPAKVSLKIQWLRNGKAIRGGTKTKYKLTRKDRGKRISVRVTGKKPGYATVSKASKSKRVR